MDYDVVDSSQPGLRAIEPSGAQENRERLEGKRKFRVNAKDANNRDLMTRQVFTAMILFCFVFQAGSLSLLGKFQPCEFSLQPSAHACRVYKTVMLGLKFGGFSQFCLLFHGFHRTLLDEDF